MIIECSENPVFSSSLSPKEASTLTQQLESGKVLFFPNLGFQLDEGQLLSAEACLGKGRKSMTYYCVDGSMKGIDPHNKHTTIFKSMMQRYVQFSKDLIHHLCPRYLPYLRMGRTSFRPIEVKGRKLSPRKDDTRLHVDAFPSMPMGENRILRVFSNVNPNQQNRVWKLGEAFNEVVSQFFPRLRKPYWGELAALQALQLTRKKRSLYDHYMLQLHNQMKYDMSYQLKAKQQTVLFPPGSTWVVYSDVVSHAALEGAFLVEQTLYVPYKKMQDPALAPQSILGEYL